MSGSYKYDISVLIINYNSEKEKLIYTINSILIQEDVLFEIIIADDGSKKEFFCEIENYFDRINFLNYIIVRNPTNRGTVINISTGLQVCRGQYVKLISPGDFLYKKRCLREWIDFSRERNAKISFGDVIYYQINGGSIEAIPYRASPQDVRVYDKYSRKVIDNYLFLGDTIHGVSVICVTSILKRYIDMIIGKVIYAEDGLYRIVVKDGIRIFHYPKDVVLYEFGTGISTNGSDRWKELIRKDIKNIDSIILRYNSNEKFRREYLISIDARDKKSILYKIRKYIRIPRLVLRKIIIKSYKRYTGTKVDKNYLNAILYHSLSEHKNEN